MQVKETAANPFGPPATLAGIVRYRGELAQRALRLNRFLVHISRPDQRQPFLDDEAGSMAAAGLDATEQSMVRARDYEAMLHYGVNIYAIAKSGHVFGKTLLDIGAGMAGMSPPEFLARRAQDRARGA